MALFFGPVESRSTAFGESAHVAAALNKSIGHSQLSIGTNTGRSVEDLSKDSDRMSYLTPDQAKEYGLIDRVLSSRKELPAPVPAG